MGVLHAVGAVTSAPVEGEERARALAELEEALIFELGKP